MFVKDKNIHNFIIIMMILQHDTDKIMMQEIIYVLYDTCIIFVNTITNS